VSALLLLLDSITRSNSETLYTSVATALAGFVVKIFLLFPVRKLKMTYPTKMRHCIQLAFFRLPCVRNCICEKYIDVDKSFVQKSAV
jgi:hypothetical protein